MQPQSAYNQQGIKTEQRFGICWAILAFSNLWAVYWLWDMLEIKIISLVRM